MCIHLYNPPEPSGQDAHQGSRNWKGNSPCGRCHCVPPQWLLRLPFPIPLHNHPMNGGTDENAESDRVLLERHHPLFAGWALYQVPDQCRWWEIDRPPTVGFELVYNLTRWELRHHDRPFDETPSVAVLDFEGDQTGGRLFTCLGRNSFRFIVGRPFEVETVYIEPFWP